MTKKRSPEVVAGTAWLSRVNILRGASAIAIAAMGSFGGINVAHAVPSYADAQIDITGFTLTGIVGNPNVTLVSSSVTGTDAAAYPGFAAASNPAGGTLTTGVDALQATSGPGAFPGENVFTQQLLPSNLLTPAGTRGDMRITGAIATGATSDLIAEGKLSVNGAASSNAGSGTTINATFTVTTGTTVELKFNASSFLTTSVGNIGDSAFAQVSATYTIKDSAGNLVAITDAIKGGTSTTVAPAGGNTSVSTTDPLASQTFSSPITAYDFVVNLLPGTYQLNFQDNTTILLTGAVPTVPEPASIALLGFGLAGLGMLRRRQQNT